MANQQPLGFIGVGVMGRPMATHLIDKGHEIVVYDNNPAAVAAMVQAGAWAAASVRDVCDQARVVFSSLPTPAVFSEVMAGEGGVASGSAVKIAVDLSTVGPRATKAAAAALLERGIHLVDAPVSGGAAGAQKATLAVMVAGVPAAVDEVMPLLQSSARLFSLAPTRARPSCSSS